MEKRQDITLGAIFVALGISAAWMATSYTGASGIYPMVLGIILALLGLIVSAKAVLAGTDQPRELIKAPSKLITTVIIGFLYVGAVVPLGFYTASFLLMLLLPFALGFRQAIYALTVALVFIGIVYAVFSLLLEKPLPREALLTVFGAGG